MRLTLLGVICSFTLGCATLDNITLPGVSNLVTAVCIAGEAIRGRSPAACLPSVPTAPDDEGDENDD